LSNPLIKSYPLRPLAVLSPKTVLPFQEKLKTAGNLRKLVLMEELSTIVFIGSLVIYPAAVTILHVEITSANSALTVIRYVQTTKRRTAHYLMILLMFVTAVTNAIIAL
jgi:hypothetical protein